MSRPPFWFAAVLALAPTTAPAQPPSPLELVRGLREQGLADLALELLADLDKKPGLPPDQKAAIPLERAKTLLDAADEEPDEGARAGMVAEAKEGFTAFLRATPNHPRAPEASLALARLISLEAKAQLARAKRLDPAPEDDAGKKKKKEEAAKARPLFKVAANRFGEAAKQIEARLKEPNLDAPTRRLIERDVFEADLSRGVNQYSMADTFIDPDAKEKAERDNYLKEAFDLFDRLAKGPQTVRTVWVARAWKGECEMERDRNVDGETEFKAVLAAQVPAAEDGKRMVQFFQLRRAFLQSIGNTQAMAQAASLASTWLGRYDSPRRPSPEAVATKFYLALNLQIQAELGSPKPKDPKAPVPLLADARGKLERAERLYRVIAQTDNDYTERAAKRRMQVVRRLLGEADRPPAEYRTFEESQMAALVQMAKLADAERDGAEADALKARRLKIVALLERARELATPKDNPADVADALVRLIYFYQASEQPYQAAVLGEHIARTMKLPGGKPALAGVMGINGYATATAALPAGAGIEEARRSDRDRAIRLARFLDERYATDPAADRARHRLAALLMEEGKPLEAYDTVLKVRPGYDGITAARLLQGAVAYQLVGAADSPLPPDRKTAVFRRTAAELEKAVRPEATADPEDVRGYVSTRCRLALLYLLQSRADADGEKATPGFVKARRVAEEVLAQIPAYPDLQDAGKKIPTLDGLELTLLAQDARTRAAYLWGRALLEQGKGDEAFAALNDLLTEMKNYGPYFTDEMRRWQADDQAADGAKKARVANLAGGVDKTRRDVIVLAVKARVRQGQVDQAAALIDLLKSFGGSVEANVPVLQQLSVELTAQIRAARGEGKADEAKTLTDGFTKMLDKLSAEPTLPAGVQLFIGQSLNNVGEHARAVEVLRKIPAPDPAVPAKDQTPDQQRAAAVHRVGALNLVRALRGAKQFKEADDLLKKAIGTPDKPGFASNSLDFRKEVAYLYEAQGADEPDLKKANALWGQALREWNGLYGIARKRLGDAEAKRAKADVPETDKPSGAAVLTMKNAFYESYFDVNRCVAKANQQLLKNNPQKLQDSVTATAKKFAEIEQSGGADIAAEVRNKFTDLLAELPELKKAYQAQGGKLFLERAGDQ